MTEDNKNLAKIHDFLHVVENLKSTLRYCHTKTGRKESTAEHSWRLALMVFLVAGELKLKINLTHALKLALVHDIAEAITGDIDFEVVSSGKVTKKEKNRLETKAIKKLKKMLPGESGQEIFDLWEEYEYCRSKEAKFVKVLDKIETLIQIGEMGFEKMTTIELNGIYGNKEIDLCPQLKPLMRLVKEELKKEFERGNIVWKKEYEV
jgi:putative hydrolase of HD superfamily